MSGNPPLTPAISTWREPAAATRDVDSRLHELADEILLLARGDGVAIALADHSEMRCRAISGSIAPPRGARIDSRSGLTGACVSSGTLLCCDDSENDSRVDRDVCRALGIRAMICVPVKAGQELVGIFEIFSSRPQAFHKADLGGLRAKAEEVARCFAGAEAFMQAAQMAGAKDTTGPTLPAAAWMPVPARPFLRRQVNWLSAKTWRALLGGLVLVLGLFLLLRALRGPTSPQPASAATPPVSNDNLALQAPLPSSAAPAEPRREPRRVRSHSTPRPQQQAALLLRPAPITVVSDVSKPPARAPQPTPPAALLGAEASPDAGLDQLVTSVPAAQPALAKSPRVSTGIAPPLLIHRVDPVYPAMARQSGIEGAVVLSAIVDKTGKVSQLRVVKGNSLLAAAALRAVRQWRYRPYRLNGEPIEVAVKVTLNFELTK